MDYSVHKILSYVNSKHKTHVQVVDFTDAHLMLVDDYLKQLSKLPELKQLSLVGNRTEDLSNISCKFSSVKILHLPSVSLIPKAAPRLETVLFLTH
jgi:hypothetical protein